MKTPLPRALILVAALLGCTAPALATDVDGPNDCLRPVLRDFGDAPDGIDAYPGGILGRFPTCIAAGSPAGAQDVICSPISSMPGAANGYVRHQSSPGGPPYWLGWITVGPPLGIDLEDDGKVNLTGVGTSACSPLINVDNAEISWLTFGQDEAYGDNDAGVTSAVSFTACNISTVTFRTYNCGAARPVTLNILVDWNEDGDWNDNFECSVPPVGCAYEWALKNATIVIPAGFGTITSPSFQAGPRAGRGWMRITIADPSVPDDFPWNGSVGMATQTLLFGETEDYPVTILPGPGGGCPNSYQDWGDAPENLPAYGGGIVGQFPTCLAAGGVATVEDECGTAVSPPGPAGFVRHDAIAADPDKFWLGCPSGTGFDGVDGEADGKVNHDPPMGVTSHCDPTVTVDGFEASWLNFGQDEAYGDADAGIGAALSLPTCQDVSLSFRAFNCMSAPREVYLNLLVDWNEDGDWTDELFCPGATPACAPEWAVRNALVTLDPGCNTVPSPAFHVGPRAGQGWLRVTLTGEAVPADFPWNGSISTPSHGFTNGETEDYPVRIDPSTAAVGDRSPGEIQLAATPNPARLSTVLRWSQPTKAQVSLAIFDIVGRKLAQVIDRVTDPGQHQAVWDLRATDGKEVAPGVYLAKLRIGEQVITTRVIRAR